MQYRITASPLTIDPFVVGIQFRFLMNAMRSEPDLQPKPIHLQIESLPAFTRESAASKKKRRKRAEREAKEAEELLADIRRKEAPTEEAAGSSGEGSLQVGPYCSTVRCFTSLLLLSEL